jgi:filamin
LAATAVGKTSFFTLSNVIGSVEDIEIVIDSPLGDSVPTQVQEISKGTFKAEFCPRVAGEHQVCDRFTLVKNFKFLMPIV